MSSLLAVAVAVAYTVFVFSAERLWPFSAPRGSVARRRWQRGVRLGPGAGLLLVAAGSAVLVPAPLGWSLAIGSALLALVLFASLRSARTGAPRLAPTPPASPPTSEPPAPKHLRRQVARARPAHPTVPDIVLDRTE